MSARELRDLFEQADRGIFEQSFRRVEERDVIPVPADTTRVDKLHSLYETLLEVKKDGWRPVPEHTIELGDEYLMVTKLKDPGLRSAVSGSSVFWRHMSDAVLTHIAEHTQAAYKLDVERGTALITKEDIRDFVKFIVAVIGLRVEDVRSFREKQGRNVISVKMYKRIMKYLAFDPAELFRLYNESLHSCVEVGGHGAIDESMWAYRGDDALTVYLARKPKPLGFRCFVLAFQLDLTSRAVVRHIIPDLVQPCYEPNAVVRSMIEALPPLRPVTITVDAYFSNLPLMDAIAHVPMIQALARVDIGKLADLCVYDLQLHEVRSFTNDSVVVTAWHDNGLVLSASNAVVWRECSEIPQNEGRRIGFDSVAMEPRLTVEDIGILSTLSQAGLAALSKAMGVSRAGNRSELAYRIGSRQPPSTTPNIVPPTPTQPDALQQRIDELTRESLNTLKSMARARSISAGNKTKKELAKKIAKSEARANDPAMMKAHIDEFVRPFGTKISDRRPFITQLYGNTFNAVDLLDRYLSDIEYRGRYNNRLHCWLIELVKLSISQSWALTNDWNAHITGQTNAYYVIEHAEKLATEFVQS